MLWNLSYPSSTVKSLPILMNYVSISVFYHVYQVGIWLHWNHFNSFTLKNYSFFSVLQALYFCVPFREQLLEFYANNKNLADGEENLLSCLADLFSQVKIGFSFMRPLHSSFLIECMICYSFVLSSPENRRSFFLSPASAHTCLFLTFMLLG